MAGNIDQTLLRPLQPERFANMQDFHPRNANANSILFANLNYEGINLMTQDKQKLIDATKELIAYNIGAIQIVENFIERESRYIENNDQAIQKKARKEITGIKTENTLYENKIKKSQKYIDSKVQGKDMVSVQDLQEGLQEIIRLQGEINKYVSVAKNYNNNS